MAAIIKRIEVDGVLYDIAPVVVQSTGQSTEYAMSQKAVTDELDTFRVVERSANIFNPALVTVNKTVDYSGNIVDVTNGDMISQTFLIRGGETAITTSYVSSSGTQGLQGFVVTFFDEDMNMLSQGSTVRTIPAGAMYFIINIGNIFASALDRIMVEYGSTMTEFEPYKEDNVYIKPECIKTSVVQSTGQSTEYAMSQKAVTDELDTFRVQGSEVVITGTNIFNPHAVVADKTVDYSGNIVAATNGDMISQTFKVKDGETAVTLSYVTGGGTHQLQSMIVTFFDASMKMLQQANNSVQSIPAGAKYFIANIGNIFASALGRIMIQYGNEMTTFEPYYEKVEKVPTYIKNECLEFVDFEESRNMYNYKTRTDNASMNTDGTTIENTLRSASDYIPCYGKGIFSAGTGAEGVYCFYNASKTFLSFGVFSNGTENITIPVDAHYLRSSCAQSYARTFTISFTPKAIQYERYGATTANIVSDFDAKNCKSVISEIIASGGQIKLLGDSITHGVGGTGFAQDGEIIPDTNTEFRVNTSGYCWANIFKKYIEEKFGNNVINFGTKGIRSYDIMRRLEADNGYVTDDDKLLIIMIGTNNKWATTTDTLNDLKNDIQWIVDWCAANNKKLILISAPMSTVLWDTQYPDGSLVKFHNEDIDHIYKEVAFKNNMDYVPMYQRMVEYCDLKDIDINTIFNDGLHPNDKGYYIMYKILMKELGLAYQLPGSSWDDASPSV